jgi:hypothetical protein
MVREILKKACSSQISCGDSWELNAVSQEKKWEKLENIYYLRNYSHSLASFENYTFVLQSSYGSSSPFYYGMLRQGKPSS